MLTLLKNNIEYNLICIDKNYLLSIRFVNCFLWAVTPTTYSGDPQRWGLCEVVAASVFSTLLLKFIQIVSVILGQPVAFICRASD